MNGKMVTKMLVTAIVLMAAMFVYADTEAINPSLVVTPSIHLYGVGVTPLVINGTNVTATAADLNMVAGTATGSANVGSIGTVGQVYTIQSGTQSSYPGYTPTNTFSTSFIATPVVVVSYTASTTNAVQLYVSSVASNAIVVTAATNYHWIAYGRTK